MHPNPLVRFFGMARLMFHMQLFYRDHVKPAVTARRAAPRDSRGTAEGLAHSVGRSRGRRGGCGGGVASGGL